MDRTIVVGDIHGDLNQLIYPLLYFVKNYDKCRKIIYLGDYIDRGDSNVFIYELINMLLKCSELKNRVIFLRGNHESYEGSVYDYMSTDMDKLNSTESTIKSFMYDKFADLNLDLVYYDREKNILYSHAPLSRNLDKVLRANKYDMKTIQDITYSMDKELSSSKYRNIHGHDHKMSSNDDIEKFMRGEKKMISLDGDSSYGIRMIQNAYKKTERWTEYITSEVKYLIMYDDGRFSVVNETVNYQSDNDLNTKSFNFIKMLLFSKCRNIKSIIRGLSVLTLTESINKFKEEYTKIFRDDMKFRSVLYNLRELYETNIKRKRAINIYFNDVPMEIYQMFGMFKPTNEYIPIYKLYWFRVLNFNQEEDEENNKNNKNNIITHRYKIKPEEKKNNVYVVMVIVVGMIVVLSLVTYTISTSTNSSSQRSKEMIRAEKEII